MTPRTELTTEPDAARENKKKVTSNGQRNMVKSPISGTRLYPRATQRLNAGQARRQRLRSKTQAGERCDLSGDGELRRGAAGTEGNELAVRIIRAAIRRVEGNVAVECCRQCGFRLRHLRGSCSAAAIVIASGGSYKRVSGIGQSIAVAVVLTRSAAAQMRRGSGALQRQGKESPGKGKQQQESCGPTLHVLVESEPEAWDQHRTGCSRGATRSYFIKPPSVKAITRFMRTNIRS